MQTIDAWLDELASPAPAPGGGAAAALSASTGASLICMVCNLTIGKPKYAAFQETLTAALARAQEIRQAALRLVDEDARAFSAVMAAYQLPRGDDAERAARAVAVQEALAAAAQVSLRIAELAAEVIGLADGIVDGANVNVISDVGVAAATARAGLQSALVTVEVNLAGMTDAQARQAIAREADRCEQAIGRADAVVGEVRGKIAR